MLYPGPEIFGRDLISQDSLPALYTSKKDLTYINRLFFINLFKKKFTIFTNAPCRNLYQGLLQGKKIVEQCLAKNKNSHSPQLPQGLL